MVDTRYVLAVRRRYLVVLAAAAIAAVLSVVIPNNGAATTSVVSPADFARVTAAVNRMKLPTDFVRVSSFDPGVPCPGDRCYIVARPTTAVAAIATRMVRTVATIAPHTTLCTLLHPRGHATMENCQFGANVPNSFGFTVVVSPYIACSTPRRCELTNKSEVLIDGLNASQLGGTSSTGDSRVTP